jgi:hypothetical protein
MTPVKLLDEKEAAEFLHCTVAFLRRRRLFRTGPMFAKLGRLVRYRMEDLVAYVAENLEGQAA